MSCTSRSIISSVFFEEIIINKRLSFTRFLLKPTITSFYKSPNTVIVLLASKSLDTVVVRLASKSPDTIVVRLASKRPDTIIVQRVSKSPDIVVVLLTSKRPNTVIVQLVSKSPDTVVVQLASKYPNTVVVQLAFSRHGCCPIVIFEQTWFMFQISLKYAKCRQRLQIKYICINGQTAPLAKFHNIAEANI